jgi:hypothetical protein
MSENYKIKPIDKIMQPLQRFIQQEKEDCFWGSVSLSH